MPLPALSSDLRTRLDALRAELAAMPAHKAGSQWHLDRAAELDLTEAQLSRLEPAEQP